MKILHICTDQNIGGAGRWIQNLLQYADRTQFTFTVLLPVGAQLAPQVAQMGIPVIEAPIAQQSFNWQAIATLRREIAKAKPDIVHTHGSLSGRIAARLTRRKVVMTRHWVDLPGHTAPKGAKANLVGRINAGLADIFIATARVAAESLIRSGVPAQQIEIIPNGVAPIIKRGDDWIAEERARIGATGFVIGMLARLEAVKGHGYMIAAAKRLKAQGRMLTVLFAGTGSLEAELKAEVQAQGMEKEIKFLGFTEQPGDFLNLLDVQVNASYTETSCLALLEGMSGGIAAVASDGGGNKDVIRDGENGLLFPVGDTEALVTCLKRLMDDPKLRRTCAEHATRIFDQTYTGATFARHVEQVYRRTMNER